MKCLPLGSTALEDSKLLAHKQLHIATINNRKDSLCGTISCLDKYNKAS